MKQDITMPGCWTNMVDFGGDVTSLVFPILEIEPASSTFPFRVLVKDGGTDDSRFNVVCELVLVHI